MANEASTFYDHSLICREGFEPVNFAIARVETKTFIDLLRTYMDLIRFRIPGTVVDDFFDCYDDALIKMAEVERAIKGSEMLFAKTTDTNVAESEGYQFCHLNDWEYRRESIRDLIEKLQNNLYDAAIKCDNKAFTYLLINAESELREKVDYLYELINE